MRTLLAIFALSIALSASAQNYVLYSFTGTGPDVYAKATSTDGRKWTVSSPAASWSSCQNGSPCKVNSPSPLCIGGTGALCTGGNIYIVIADANDQGLTNTHIDIGLDNTTTNAVTTITTVDMSTSISGIYTVFAPRWIQDGSNCMYIPVATGGGFNFSTYLMCATSITTGGVTFGSPTLVTTSGITSGYDPAGYLLNGTYYLLQTEYLSGAFGQATCISTASSRTGPFTAQTCSSIGAGGVFGSPLFAEIGPAEGPGYFQLPGSNQIMFYYENIQDSPVQIREMMGSQCSGLPLVCVIATPTIWNMDQKYRAGVVFPASRTITSGSALESREVGAHIQ